MVDFERFHRYNFRTKFLKNEKHFLENWNTVFELKALRLKTQFHTKLPIQEPVLRQTEWRVQNKPIIGFETLFL